MSLATQLALLAQAVGTDIKALHTKIGSLTSLTTTDKTSIVAAINELVTNVSNYYSLASNLIQDTPGSGVKDHTWSADKILAYTAQLKSDIMGGIPSAALDTIYELATQLQADGGAISGILTSLGLRVRVDAAQSFDSTQQTQGRSNIGAAAQADFSNLVSAIGDTDQDLVAVYNTAKS